MKPFKPLSAAETQALEAAWRDGFFDPTSCPHPRWMVTGAFVCDACGAFRNLEFISPDELVSVPHAELATRMREFEHQNSDRILAGLVLMPPMLLSLLAKAEVSPEVSDCRGTLRRQQCCYYCGVRTALPEAECPTSQP